MKTAAMVAIAAVLVGCQRIPHRPVEEKHAAEAAAPVRGGQRTGPPASRVVPRTVEADSGHHCGLTAYPFPRPYKQMMSDAAAAIRKPTGSLHVKMAIDASGNITHLRFMSLSTFDSVNEIAFQAVTTWQFKPPVLNGERVATCSTTDINVDF